jgi:hypothetical protein
VLDVEFRQAKDEVIWEYVSANSLVLITKDEDFSWRAAAIAARTSGGCEYGWEIAEGSVAGGVRGTAAADHRRIRRWSEVSGNSVSLRTS